MCLCGERGGGAKGTDILIPGPASALWHSSNTASVCLPPCRVMDAAFTLMPVATKVQLTCDMTDHSSNFRPSVVCL